MLLFSANVVWIQKLLSQSLGQEAPRKGRAGSVCPTCWNPSPPLDARGVRPALSGTFLAIFFWSSVGIWSCLVTCRMGLGLTLVLCSVAGSRVRMTWPAGRLLGTCWVGVVWPGVFVHFWVSSVYGVDSWAFCGNPSGVRRKRVGGHVGSWDPRKECSPFPPVTTPFFCGQSSPEHCMCFWTWGCGAVFGLRAGLRSHEAWASPGHAEDAMWPKDTPQLPCVPLGTCRDWLSFVPVTWSLLYVLATPVPMVSVGTVLFSSSVCGFSQDNCEHEI